MYGNSQYGYIVAEANGLSGDSSDLVVGQGITIPSVTTSSNTANTFKPYNPNEVVGSTTPSLPTVPPPPPSQAGCNTLAMIVIIAVVVVASIFTAGLAAEAMAGTLSSFTVAGTMSAGMAAMTGGALGVAAVGVEGSLVGAGVAVGGSAAFASVAAGAAAAFAGGVSGNVAGQLVGDAEGVSHGLSWRQALAGGLTAAAGSAMGSELGDVHQGLLANGSWEKAAVSGAATSLAGTAANKISGVPQHFSWASVVATTVASAVTAEVAPHIDNGLNLDPYGMGADFTNRFVEGSLDMQAERQLGLNTPVDYGSIATDAFGNALADAIDGQDAAEADLAQRRNEVAHDVAGEVARNNAIRGANSNLFQNVVSTNSASTAYQQAGASFDVEGATADAPSGSQQGSGNIILPNGDAVLPDGTVLSGDGTGPIDYVLNAAYKKDGSTSSWASGDRSALKALLASQDPSAVTYDTRGFDPTAAPNLSLGYGVDNSAVNAEIAKSPIMTAELNEALARGDSVQITLDGGEYDMQNNLITIPAAYANSPDAIVSALAHELGHVMWGDVTIPQSAALAMDQQHFVEKQVSLELQNEGVATINNVAVSEQIWGASNATIKYHISGTAPVGAPGKFGADYALFSKGSASLEQAAGDIGAFYATNENPANDLNETYQSKYTRVAQRNYGIYSTNEVSHNEFQKLQEWRRQIIAGQRHDVVKFTQAVRAYETSKRGGH